MKKFKERKNKKNKPSFSGVNNSFNISFVVTPFTIFSIFITVIFINLFAIITKTTNQ